MITEICPVFNAATHRRADTYDEYADGDRTVRAYHVEEIPIGEVRAAAKACAAAARWQAETGGITVGGHKIQTDRDSRSIMVQAITLGWPEGSSWKCEDGTFVAFSAADFSAVVAAVAAHVRACFDREAAIVAEIDAAADTAAVLAIDTSAGWPG